MQRGKVLHAELSHLRNVDVDIADNDDELHRETARARDSDSRSHVALVAHNL